jgi:hypothetical protein
MVKTILSTTEDWIELFFFELFIKFQFHPIPSGMGVQLLKPEFFIPHLYMHTAV